MESVISKQSRARVNLACPQCQMDLRKAPQAGFVKNSETYCCQGCADGTGCTCGSPLEIPQSSSRRGDIGQRNSENTPRDKNFNGEQDTSGQVIGKRKRAVVPEVKSRDQRQWDPRSKRLKTQNKPKDSTREQARGRSEQRGRLGRPAGSANQDRISRTGSKGK